MNMKEEFVKSLCLVQVIGRSRNGNEDQETAMMDFGGQVRMESPI